MPVTEFYFHSDPGDPDPTVRERSLAIMEGAVSLAARLGVRIIQLAGYDVYYKKGGENTRRFFAENLKRSVFMAARQGVGPLIKNRETLVIEPVPKLIY